MADRTTHQKKIIERYYDQRDNIMLTRLQEHVTDLFLADSDRKRDALWKRVEKALKNLKVKPPQIAQLINPRTRNPETLARHIRDWQSQASSR